MIFDYYASFSQEKPPKIKADKYGLASGFVDEHTAWSCRKKPQTPKAPDPKNEARMSYIENAGKCLRFEFPAEFRLGLDSKSLLHPDWFGIKVDFKLESPWYSKDDRPFHVMDNPVRKDRIFGVPFMSAASWKGLLRWACRMHEGLFGYLEKYGMEMDEWEDSGRILHLFGNEREDETNFRSGSLVFYPTWFNQVGFEVVNPHDRARRAGTHPIYYEVVPAGAEGCLQLFYAPPPGAEARMTEKYGFTAIAMIDLLVESIQELLVTYGFSAKRTAGWGTAEIKEWTAYAKGIDQFMDKAKSKQDRTKRTVNTLQDIGTIAVFPPQKVPDEFSAKKDAEKLKEAMKQWFRKKGDFDE